MANRKPIVLSSGKRQQILDTDKLIVGAGVLQASGTLTLGQTGSPTTVIGSAIGVTSDVSSDITINTGNTLILQQAGATKWTLTSSSMTIASGVTLTVTSNATVGGTLGVTGILTATGAIYANGGLDRSTAAALAVGTTNANAITLGGASTPVTTGQNLLVTGIIDRNAAGPLNIGTATATAITLGGAAVPVTTGQNLLVTGVIDRNAAGALTIASTTATSVVIGSSVTATSVTANAATNVNLQIGGSNVLQIGSASITASQVLNANGNIDRSSAATLSIGVVNATTVNISRAAQNVAIANTISIAGATTATGAVFADGGVDRSAAAALAIGGTNATSVTIGSAVTAASVTMNAATNVNLQIGGSTKLQVASTALTVQAGVTLAATGTGNINLPNNASAKFQIETVAVGTTVTAVNLNTLTNGSNADALHSHAGLGATPTQVRAGGLTTTGITSGNATYISANSTVSHTDSAAIASARCVGFYAGTTSEIIGDGTVTANFTTAGGSPAAGASVFLAAAFDDTATGAGKLTAAVPAVGVLAEVGICVSNANYVGAKTCVVLLQVKAPIEL